MKAQLKLLLLVILALPMWAQEEIPVIPQDQIPKAVYLADIEFANRDKEANVVKVANKPVTVNTKAPIKKTDGVDMSKYITEYVAVAEANPQNVVYFIQLAALFNSRGDVNVFKHLGVYGNLYKELAGSSTKIKLGYFESKVEAVDILRQVKSMGHSDAFITQNQINSPSLELLVTGSHYIVDDYDTNSGTSYSGSASANYKVKLASYQDALWFSSASVEDLGKIEQWTKGSWTIFVLGTYHSLESAQTVLNKALQRGFSEAEIVVDNNGLLEKIN